MSGAGPAGELTFADIRKRMANVAGRLLEHYEAAETLATAEAARRDAPGDDTPPAGS